MFPPPAKRPTGLIRRAGLRRQGMALISVLLLVALLAIIIAVFAAVVTNETLSTSSQRDKEIARQNALFGLRVALGQLQEQAGPDQRVTARAEILNTANDFAAAGVVPATNSTPVSLAKSGNELWTGVWKTSNTTATDQNLDTGGNIRNWSYRTTGPTWLVSAPSETTPNPEVVLSGSMTGTMANYQLSSGSAATVQVYLVPVGQGTISYGDYGYWVSDEGVKAKANIVNPWAQTDAEADASQTKSWLQNQLSFMAPQRTAIEKMDLLTGYPATKSAWTQSGTSPQLATDWPSLLLVSGVNAPEANTTRLQRFPDVTFSSEGVLADARSGGLKTDLTAAFADPTWKSSGTDAIFVDGSNIMGPPWSVLKSYGNLWDPKWWENDPFGSSSEIMGSFESHTMENFVSNSGIGAFQTYVSTDRSNVNYHAYQRQDINAIPLSYSLVFGLQSVPDSSGNNYTLQWLVYPEIVLWNPYNVTVRSGSWIFHEGQLLFAKPNGGAVSRQTQMEIQLLKSGSSTWKIVGNTTPSGVAGTTTYAPKKYFHGTLSSMITGGANTTDPDLTDVSNVFVSGTFDMGFGTQGDVAMAPGQVMRFSLANSIAWTPTGTFWPATTPTPDYPIPFLVPTNNMDSSVSLPLKSFGEVYQAGDQLKVDMGDGLAGALMKPMLYFREFSGRKNTLRVDAGALVPPRLHFSGTLGLGTPLPPATNPTGAKFSYPMMVLPSHDISFTPEGLTAGVKLMGFRWQAKGLNTSHGVPVPLFTQGALRRVSDEYAGDREKPVPTGLSGGMTEYQSLSQEVFGVKAISGPLGDDDIFADNDAEVNGQAYWGDDYSIANGVPNIEMFDIPRQPLLSVGALMHANFDANLWDSTYPIGSSLPNLLIPRSARNALLTPKGLPTSAPGTAVDLSHYLNENLSDTYFFSTVPPASLDTSTYPPFAALTDQFIDGDKALPNGRMKFYRRDGANPSVTDLQSSARAAANLLLDGAFNINSTSVEAWMAVLGSLSMHPLALRMANGSSVKVAGTDTNNPFPRLTSPQAGINLSGAAKNWAGFRSLTDDELRKLATQIVRQVKLRGPFLGVGDFLNRRLGADTDYRTGDGALHDALSLAAVNTGWGGKTNKVESLQNPAVGTSANAADTPNLFVNNKDPDNTSAAGQPAWLMESDIYKALAPILSARSDTFVIRCLGEKKNPAGVVIARAWCEAVVQRTPDFIDPTDAAYTAIGSLTKSVNTKFGRRFQVISFRWLNPNEI